MTELPPGAEMRRWTTCEKSRRLDCSRLFTPAKTLMEGGGLRMT